MTDCWNLQKAMWCNVKDQGWHGKCIQTMKHYYFNDPRTASFCVEYGQKDLKYELSSHIG